MNRSNQIGTKKVFLHPAVFVMYFSILRCLIKGGGPNKRGGQADLFIYYMKNSGEGEIFFGLLHEKQGEGVKRGSPF